MQDQRLPAVDVSCGDIDFADRGADLYFCSSPGACQTACNDEALGGRGSIVKNFTRVVL